VFEIVVILKNLYNTMKKLTDNKNTYLSIKICHNVRYDIKIG